MSWYHVTLKRFFDTLGDYASAILWQKLIRALSKDIEFKTELIGPLKTNLYKIIGCGNKKFKEHITKTFDKNMNWENYGSWHIDHIVPKSYFNLENKDEFAICWNYRNLRALNAKENLHKSNKLLKNFKSHICEIGKLLNINTDKMDLTTRNHMFLKNEI
jgi:Uri superfamily endonuclease